jgi:S-adenosylmethionine-diacylglycerol 3-amino-3-carboxypropyl transferase
LKEKGFLMKDFYSRLSYGLGNEDWNTEKQALQIQNEHTVLCITASGDRPLNLLTKPCSKMISIDLNPIQNALLDLKICSLRHMDFDKYLEFLGVLPCKSRWDLFNSIKKHLQPKSAEIWEQQKKKIVKGVVYQGVLEKACKNVSSILHFLNGKKLRTLFSLETLEEQREFVETKFLTPLWKKTLLALYQPSLLKFLIRDPGLYAHVDPSIHTGPYLVSKIEHSLKTHRIQENIILSLLMNGKVDRPYLPPYLKSDGFEAIKQNIDSIEFETINLVDFLKGADELSIDRFSLSDVASYMPYKQFTSVLENIKRVAKPEARFCIRQFMSKYEFPEHLSGFFERESDLEKQLESEDRCFLYTFAVGKLAKERCKLPEATSDQREMLCV